MRMRRARAPRWRRRRAMQQRGGDVRHHAARAARCASTGFLAWLTSRSAAEAGRGPPARALLRAWAASAADRRRRTRRRAGGRGAGRVLAAHAEGLPRPAPARARPARSRHHIRRIRAAGRARRTSRTSANIAAICFLAAVCAAAPWRAKRSGSARTRQGSPVRPG
ncbi:MAG: hypothetical protein MZW92_69395 [Comamonadaceae bacterium]|nr:hypothetical protein [Comamonadaceae bacterium]